MFNVTFYLPNNTGNDLKFPTLSITIEKYSFIMSAFSKSNSFILPANSSFGPSSSVHPVSPESKAIIAKSNNDIRS